MANNVDFRLKLVSPISKSLLSLTGICYGHNQALRRYVMELFDPLTAPKSCEHVFVEDATVPVVHLSPKIHSIGVRIFAPVDLPTKKHLRPLLLWCHGGGYAIGSPFASTTDAACRNLAKMADVIIMSI